MRIGDQEFGRVAVLVLDYDPYREKRPSKAVTKAYGSLCERLKAKYDSLSGLGRDVVIVLANEELIIRHQSDFEQIGLKFFPNWQETPEYRDLLREGLRQGKELYIMRDVGSRTGVYGSWFGPNYSLEHVTEDALEIIAREGKIDIKPKHLTDS